LNLQTPATAHRFFQGVLLASVLCALLILVVAFGLWEKPPAGLKCVHEGHISYCTSEEGSCFHTIALSTELQFDKVIALQAEHIGDVVADLALKAKAPLMALVQDKELQEYVVLIDKEGELSVSSVSSLRKEGRVSDNKLKIQTALQDEAVYVKMWPIVLKP
jgi:hypothetical protein